MPKRKGGAKRAAKRAIKRVIKYVSPAAPKAAKRRASRRLAAPVVSGIPSRRRAGSASKTGKAAIAKHATTEILSAAAAITVTEGLERWGRSKDDAGTVKEWSNESKTMLQGGTGLALVGAGVMTGKLALVTAGAHQITAAGAAGVTRKKRTTEGAWLPSTDGSRGARTDGIETGRGLWEANLSGVVDDPADLLDGIEAETGSLGLRAILREIIGRLKQGGDEGQDAAVSGVLDAVGLPNTGSLRDRVQRIKQLHQMRRARAQAQRKGEKAAAYEARQEFINPGPSSKQLAAPSASYSDPNADAESQALLREISALTGM